MQVRHIEFEVIKNYWIEVNHFNDPNKKYAPIVRQLGHLNCELPNPKWYCYGLFDGPLLIGVTQFIEWSQDTVRYRTLNIRPAYRGRDLGRFLVFEAYKMDWSQFRYLFGWVRESHYAWARRQNFKEVDGVWNDGHIAMIKNMVDGV